MFIAAVFNGHTRTEPNANHRMVTGWCEDRPQQLWIDLQSPSAEDLAYLQDRFSLHPLAVEECDHTGVRPKIEEFEDHLFLVLHGINHNEGTDRLRMVEFKIFLRRNVLITIHDAPSRSIRKMQERMRTEPELLGKKGVDTVLHHIVDAMIDHYFPILEEFEEQVEQFETDVFRNPSHELQERMLGLQRRILTMNRVIQPQLDILGALTSGRYPEIEPEDVVYFRDVYDHLQRIAERLHVVREMLTGALQCYLAQLSNRMNSVMKSLAVLGTVLLPASFISGLLGMNLEYMPGRNVPTTFWAVAGISIAASLGLVLLLRSRKWL